MGLTVVDATEEHLAGIAAIYDEAAEKTPATFDLEGPPIEYWLDAAKADELLVAVSDGEVLGFAKSGPFKTRPAYDTTRETSAYVHADHRGKGVGNALYTELLRRLDATEGLLLAVAGITQPNPASDALHVRHGFTVVGTFEDVGVKLGRAWSVRWYQRALGGASTSSSPAGA